MKKKLLITILMFIILIARESKAQGCSDGGACSVNSFRLLSNGDLQVKTDDIYSTGLTFGLGNDKVKVLIPYFEYSRQIIDELTISGKLTYVYATGDLGSNNKFGDLFITGNYGISLIDGIKTSVTGGTKIPLNKADANSHAIPYPMVYQSSVGTYDIILGLNADYDEFSFGLGLQFPLAFVNDNNYSPLFKYDNNNITPNVSTRNLRRMGDVFLRLTCHFDLIDELLTVTLGILPIYHLSNDTYSNLTGDENIEIENSKGLTLNGTLALNLSLHQNHNLILSFGTPFITREVFPDGLKRSFVAGLEFKVSF